MSKPEPYSVHAGEQRVRGGGKLAETIKELAQTPPPPSRDAALIKQSIDEGMEKLIAELQKIREVLEQR